MEEFDAVVVGAGFGGLGAGLALAEAGAKVLLCERLRYPGGCASTFERGGYRFEAGATLFAGLGEGQLFDRWIQRHKLDVEVEWMDPVVEVRAPGLTLPVPRDRRQLVEAFAALPDAPRPAIERFFAEQRSVADVLWSLLDEPDLLPPLSWAAIRRHLLRVPGYGPVLRCVGRPLTAILRRHGLDGFTPLVTYLNGLTQITIQCPADRAEAPFALACMDYYFRGAGHVRHGIGTLAWGLADAIERLGGSVSMADEVRRIEPDGARWRVVTRRRTVVARDVVVNLLPRDAAALVHGGRVKHRAIAARQRAVEQGYGACMLYRVVAPPAGFPSSAHHLELVADPSAAFEEGNHVFCSISSERDEGRAPAGLRAMTVSTHLPMGRTDGESGEDIAARVGRVHRRMDETVRTLAPEWCEVRHAMTASPRTFHRFTARHRGFVGGAPRTAGLRHYLDLSPRQVAQHVHLVGDSVFPGQSTLAAAIGGLRCAARITGPGRRPPRR